jgi:hypothetical protein
LELRALFAEQHLEKLKSTTELDTRVERIERMMSSQAPLWQIGSIVRREDLPGRVLRSKMSNPNPKTIKRFLGFLGVDIGGYLNVAREAHLLNQVEGLVELRNAVAHGSLEASSTYVDIDSYLYIVGRLCDQVDTAVACSLNSICGRADLFW